MLSWEYFEFKQWKQQGRDKEIAKQVVELSFRYLTIKSLSTKIKYLINLEKIEIFSTEIAELPKELFQLTKLKKINCCANKIKKLKLNLDVLNEQVINFNKIK